MTGSLPCVRGVWLTSSTGKAHADYRPCWRGSELLETFFRVWVPFRTKFRTPRGGQKNWGDKIWWKKTCSKLRLIFHKLALRRMATSSYQSSPLFERWHPPPASSPASPSPPHSTRAHYVPNMRPLPTPTGQEGLSMMMPRTPGSACLGLQSTLITSDCSKRVRVAGLCLSFSDLLSACCFTEIEAKVIKTFTVKTHRVDAASPSTKGSKHVEL